MKDWLINLVVEMILKAISDEKIEYVAAQIQAFLIPFLHEQKDVLIARLRARAEETGTTLDDAAVRALDVFLSKFIPTEQCFADIKSA